MEASSHLVLDNCLLRPDPLISHIDLHQGLVCLGSKLTEASRWWVKAGGHVPQCCPRHLSSTGPISIPQEQHPHHTPPRGETAALPSKVRKPHTGHTFNSALRASALWPAALAGAHLHGKDGSYRLVVADRVLHVAAVAELAHRQHTPAGPAPARARAGRFDLPKDAVSPGGFSLLGTAGHRGASLAWQGAVGSTPTCLPLALRSTQAGDAARLGAQLSAAAGTDLHWHQHNGCVPAHCLQPTTLPPPKLPREPQPCHPTPKHAPCCPTCCRTCWCPHQT